MKKMLNKLLLLGLTLTLSINAFSNIKEEYRTEYKNLHEEIKNGKEIDYSHNNKKHYYAFEFNNRFCVLLTPLITPDTFAIQKNRLKEIENLLPKMHSEILNNKKTADKINLFLENKEFKIISKKSDEFFEEAYCDRRQTPKLLKKYIKLFETYIKKNKDAMTIIKENTKSEGLKKSIDDNIKWDEERLLKYKQLVDFSLKQSADMEEKVKVKIDYD